MTTRKEKSGGSVQVFFVLSIFLVFMLTALLVVQVGAKVYRRGVEEREDRFRTGTCLSYVTTKLRQYDYAGGVSIDAETGGIRLSEEIDGERYVTYIYHQDGFLQELTLWEGDTFDPGMGTKVLEVGDFTVEEAGEDVLRISAGDSGGILPSVLVDLHSVKS